MRVARGEGCWTRDANRQVIKVTALDLAPKGWWVMPQGETQAIIRHSLQLFPTRRAAESWEPPRTWQP